MLKSDFCIRYLSVTSHSTKLPTELSTLKSLLILLIVALLDIYSGLKKIKVRILHKKYTCASPVAPSGRPFDMRPPEGLTTTRPP